MEITTQLIDYVSTLARLRLDDREREMMQEQLQQIIGYMDVLNTLDTTGVEPMSHIFPLKNVFREDVVEPSTDRAALLANSPCPDEEAFLVPKAVE